MPKTTVFCIVGAASISAFPLFSGFVSKSMVMSALIGEGYDYLWLMLLFASAGVFHHAGIKIPFFAFFAHDRGLRVKEAPTNMLWAMGFASLACIAIGVHPKLLYQLLPWENQYQPYDLTHTLTQLQLLFFSALAFVWLNKRGLYPPELRSVNLDIEWLYRKFVPTVALQIALYSQTAREWGQHRVRVLLNKLPVIQADKNASGAMLTRRMGFVFVAMVVIAALSDFIT